MFRNNSYLFFKKRITPWGVRAQFLGAFANFLKATISFGMSVFPSVRMEQFDI
jgi:hypothetical protein